MQTSNLPIQANQANQANQARQLNQQRNGAAGGASQFGALLSNEMEQRQASVAPPAPQAPAPKQEAARPQKTEESAQPAGDADAAAAPAPAQQAAAPSQADAGKDASQASGTESAPDDDAKAAADPAAAMLALMASLQPQGAGVQETGKKSAAAFDALQGSRGKRGDAGQLAALQAALKSTGTQAVAPDTAARTFSGGEALKNPALAASGAGIAADDKAVRTNADDGAAGAADFHAALARVKTEAPAQPETLPQAAQETAPAPGAAQIAAAAVQPAVMEAAQATAAASDKLSARVGTADWNNQVGQKVVWMVGSEEQTASLTLNPPDLGPMQVVLSVTGDQASVTFSANQQEVRQALENALPRLREMMGESGIALGNATVNAGMPDGRQAQQDSGSRNGSSSGWGRSGDDSTTTVTETTVRPARTRALGDNGMVDTFA